MNDFVKGWDHLKQFHNSIDPSYPLRNKAIQAFSEIAKLAKELNLKVPNHPSFRQRFASNAHYPWLIKFDKIIKIIKEIPEYMPRLKQFFNNLDYFKSTSALYELEIALRIKLQGIQVEFYFELTEKKTPDLNIKMGDNYFDLEITTLNSPDDYKHSQFFYSKLTNLMVKYHVEMAGNIISVPLKLQNKFIEIIEQKLQGLQNSNQIIRMQEPGKFVLEFKPRHCNLKLSFFGFKFYNKMLIDVEDKIIRTIRDKNKQLQVNNLPGILCIYTGSRTADLEKIYHDEFDKIHMYLQSYPNISAVVLSTYSEFYDLESKYQQILNKNSKILIPIKPAFGNSEINIIWINEHARIKLPSIFIDTYQNYEKHINKIMGPP